MSVENRNKCCFLVLFLHEILLFSILEKLNISIEKLLKKISTVDHKA